MSTRNRFAHHEEEVWRKLGDELGGARLDAIYTCFRAPYVNPEAFRFELYRQELAHGLGKLLGVQDVQIGDKTVDKMFMIKATDEAKLKKLLADPELRKLLATEKDLHVVVRDAGKAFDKEFPEGVDELVVEVPGKVEDGERLKRLYKLFAMLLHGIGRFSDAYTRDTLLAPEA